MEPSPEHSVGREKAFVLTHAGEIYAAPLLWSLNEIEQKTVERLGQEHIRALVDRLLAYDRTLQQAVEEEGQEG